MLVLFEVDGFTFKAEDKGSVKACLNILGTVNKSPTEEIDGKVLSAIVSLVFSAMSTAIWQEFGTACAAGYAGLSKKDMTHAYRWLSARTFGTWNDRIAMT